MKQYDKVIGQQFGIICGKKNLVFIKTGRGGSIEGLDNKYINICRSLHERYGCSFVVSANPENSACDLQEEIKQIGEYVGDYNEIYFVGISNGASIGAEQCWKIDKIKNALLVNGPLMTNWHRIKDGAEKFSGEQMRFVYGDNDPSYRYIELIDSIKNDACSHSTFEGEGHNLSESSLEFELWLFLNEQMYTEAKFVISENNRTAFDAIRDAERKILDFEHRGQLLYVYGRKGSGKTHMLNALMNSSRHEGFRVQLDDAIDVGNEEDDVECYSQADMVMIDDINLLSDEAAKLEILKEAISLTGIADGFNSTDNNLVLILTSDDSPEETFKDNDLVVLIRKGKVIEITEGEIRERF